MYKGNDINFKLWLNICTQNLREPWVVGCAISQSVEEKKIKKGGWDKATKQDGYEKEKKKDGWIHPSISVSTVYSKCK